MSYLFMSVRMKDQVRIFIDENNNVEKHYYYDQSLEQWAKTARRWHDIMDNKQMYDTEIRNKMVVERTISKRSLIPELNKKQSLLGYVGKKSKNLPKSECFILFSLFKHNKILQILQINGKALNLMLSTDVTKEKWLHVKWIHDNIYLRD